MASRSSSPLGKLSEYENRFCKETSLILINYYKEYPCLYDPEHSDYIEKDVRAEAYRQIVEKLKEVKPHVTVPVVKKKIKTLLGQLYKEKMKLNRNPAYQPKLWCFKDMEFLLNKTDSSKMFVSSTNIPQHLLGKRTKSSTDDSDDNSNNISGYKSTKKERRCSLEDVAIAALQIAQNASQNDNAPKKQFTPVEAFCNYLCAEMQQLRPEIFNNLKIDIMELLNEAIIKDQQEDICQSIKEEFPSTSGRTLTTVTSLC